MNNIFNIRRFGLVFRKDFLENWKRYTLLFLTMLGVITIINTANSLSYYYDVHNMPEIEHYNYLNKRLLIYSSLMFGMFGLLFASIFMSPMNSKTKRISYLVNPASNFEKYFSRWVIITIGYIISFIAAFWIADILRVGICSARFPELEITFLDLTKLISSNDEGHSEYAFYRPVFIISTSMYLLLQSLFILGSSFWEKATFIKTFTTVVLIILSFVLICRWTILLFYGDIDSFGNVLESFTYTFDKRDINEEHAIVFVSCVISFFTISNWTLTFFRFRESEITKHL